MPPSYQHTALQHSVYLLRDSGGRSRLAAVLDRQEYLHQTLAIVPLILVGGGGEAVYAADKKDTPAPAPAPVWTEPEVTEKGFMDISIGGEPIGRLVIAVSCSSTYETFKNHDFHMISTRNESDCSYRPVINWSLALLRWDGTCGEARKAFLHPFLRHLLASSIRFHEPATLTDRVLPAHRSTL